MKTLLEKQNDAYDRAVGRSKRTARQQLALIATRPGESKREVARLTKSLHAK